MKTLFSLFLIVLAYVAPAKKQGLELIDSLKTRVKISTDDTTKVRLLGKLSFQYFRFDTDSGIYYAKSAIKLAGHLDWKTGLAFSFNYLGTNYAVKGDFPKALEYFGKSLTVYTEIGDLQGIGFLSNNLGNFYRMQKDYPKSIEFINKAIEVNKKLNNKLDLVKSYNNLGSVYSEISDLTKSNEYYNKALILAREINDKEQKSIITINLADNYTSIKNYCKALELGFEAIKISDESDEIYDKATNYGVVGGIYYTLSTDSTFQRGHCLFYSKDKQTNLLNAKKYLQKSLNLLEQVHDQSEISNIALRLSMVDENLGDYENALKHYKQYSSNKDSVFSKDNSIKMANVEKKLALALKDKQIEIQKLAIDKKNTQIITQIALFILMLLLVVLISYLYHRQKDNRILKENEMKYRFLFENNPQPMFIYELDTLKFIEINKAAIDHYGYSKEEFLGLSFMALQHQADIPLFLTEIEKIRANKEANFTGEWRHLKKNGELINAELHGQTVISKGRNGQHILVLDITEKKKLVEDLMVAKKRAEESDQLKTAFLNNISHEIRTPFNGILGFLNLIQNESVDEEEKSAYFNIVNQSAARLMNTINDIIEVSQIQSGQIKLKFKDFNINSLIDNLYVNLRVGAERKGLQFETKMPAVMIQMTSDYEKLYSILSNLVVNAIKFTKNGSLQIGYHLNKNRDFNSDLIDQNGERQSTITFFVKDTGIGIAKDKQQLIFQRFMQVETSNTRHFEGSGLGLFIVKAYVEMLGGEILIESDPGNGSLFHFTLPILAGADNKTLPAFSTDDQLTKLVKDKFQILVVDDDQYSAKLISIILRKIGIEIINVDSGLKAIEICQKMPGINLILMDIKMPDLDGYETVRLIRQFNTNLIIIAQSAYTTLGEREKAILVGCNEYISKPINKNELINLIIKYLKI